MYLFGRERAKKGKRVLDYIKDFSFIQASFKQIYNIDLRKENLSWWEFQAYFDGCFETIDNPIKKVVEYRASPLPTGQYAQEERKYLIAKKNQYRLETKKGDGLREMALALKSLARKG